MRNVLQLFFCFCFPFAWNVFFHPLTFCLYVGLGLKWVSFRQYIYMALCFVSIQPGFWLEHLIHLHLKYLFIYIFLLPFSSLFGIDFVGLFSSLVFLDYTSPFNTCCKAGLVVLNSLNFCLSEKLFISPSILNEIVAGYSNLGGRLFSF